MNAAALENVRSALLEAGVEVFRVDGEVVHLAERVRSHLMDAGVRVRCGRALAVDLTVRAQRSDFPGEAEAAMFDRVRGSVAADAAARGFGESEARARDVRDPVDSSRVLDVWYELTFSKPVLGVETLIDDVRWALGRSKCIER